MDFYLDVRVHLKRNLHIYIYVITESRDSRDTGSISVYKIVQIAKSSETISICLDMIMAMTKYSEANNIFMDCVSIINTLNPNLHIYFITESRDSRDTGSICLDMIIVMTKPLTRMQRAVVFTLVTFEKTARSHFRKRSQIIHRV